MDDKIKTQGQPADELTDLRSRAEGAVRGNSSALPDISTISTEQLQELVHELHVHQVELEMQNQELANTQRELGETLNRYQNLYDFAPVGYLTVDRKGLILEANLTGTQLLGADRASLIGQPFSRFVFKEDADTFYMKLREVFEASLKRTWEIRLTNHSEGNRFHAKLEAIAVKDHDGSIKQSRIILSDITDRKLHERESENLRLQLIQAQKMEAVGTLAGGIAHDFNNLLQIVLGYSEFMVQRKKEGEKDYADLQKIIEAGNRGAALVQSLMTFSRKSENQPRPIKLNDQVERLTKMLSRTIPKMIQIEPILALDLAIINADPTQIDQVLMNLAVNARDAMRDEGKLSIKTANVILDDTYCGAHVGVMPGPYVLLMLSDTGQGMDKQTLQHIFEPFFTTKEKGKGTGTGLATVYGIVKQHNGSIDCYSAPGQGTTFKIYFPAIPA